MSEVLEYSGIKTDISGVITPGCLRLSKDHIIFKNAKTGKTQQIAASDIWLMEEQKLIDNWGVGIYSKTGTIHRFCGFNTFEKEEVAKYVKLNCMQNVGSARFNGSVLSSDTDGRTISDVPLSNVSQCTAVKTELASDFHQNDHAPVGFPPTETAGQDPVKAFQNRLMSQSFVISASGGAISTFARIYCLLPRGHYDIKVFQEFFQMDGLMFNYKIPMYSVLRLFLLPHKDSRGMVFVLSLDPPVEQSPTRYQHLVLQFEPEKQISIDLPFSEQELKNKYEGKLDKKLSGPVYEVFAKLMKALVGREITGPGDFVGSSGTAAISCSFKAATGYLYPLERGFLYIYQPPLHIRYEEVDSVNFARSGGSTRNFNLEIWLENRTVHTFTIDMKEHNKLFEFIRQKKLNISIRGMPVFFFDSNDESEHDGFLERLKAEAKAMELNDEDESAEDFKPNDADSNMWDEYDSNVESESDDSHASCEVEIKKKRDESVNENEVKKEEKKELKPKTKKSSFNGSRFDLEEIRFNFPKTETANEDPVKAYMSRLMSQSNVTYVSGGAIATFSQIDCLSPRGRYDIKVFHEFFQMHGQMFNYKVPMNSVSSLLLMPHTDSRGMVFVLSLDPPVEQGQTHYQLLVLQFEPEQQISIDLPYSEKVRKNKYEGKLDNKLSGPVYKVFAKLMEALVGRKITGPSDLVGYSSTAAISCSFKAATGYLYPLERGFLYAYNPVLHVRFEEIASVKFARSGGSPRNFAFEIRLKNRTAHTFTIDMKKYAKLFKFIKQKMYSLKRLKAEAEGKAATNDEDESAEDFMPNECESNAPDEYGINVESVSDDSHASEGNAGSGEIEIRKKRNEPVEKKKEKKPEKKKERKELKPKTKKRSKTKDPNKPKRPTSAFLFWLIEMREQIKRDNPDLKWLELAKKAGQIWRALQDKSKWEEKGTKEMLRYSEEMRNYKPKPDSPE